jgi:hypothetical protein
VPGLVADASGTLCIATRCEAFDRTQSYHDHNWGVWRGVSWEWGSVRAGRYGLLYGRVQPPDSAGSGSRSPLFVYLVDSLGFRALFRPRAIQYTDGRTVRVGGAEVRVPATALLYDVRGADTLRLELTVEDAVGTDTRGPLIERGETQYARALALPYFIQMKGRGRLSGRVGGAPSRARAPASSRRTDRGANRREPTRGGCGARGRSPPVWLRVGFVIRVAESHGATHFTNHATRTRQGTGRRGDDPPRRPVPCRVRSTKP